MTDENDARRPIDLETATRRAMGDMEFLKELLSDFDALTPNWVGVLHHAVECRDADLLSRTAHQLKGAASNLSLTDVAEKASVINELGRKADFENAASALRDLETAVSDLGEYLRITL